MRASEAESDVFYREGPIIFAPGSARYRTWTLDCKNDSQRTSGKNMVESRLGEDSTFRFTLPLRSGAVRETKPQ
jgi:hypothetical protein